MTLQDQIVLALTIWRENRGGGMAGMQSVANVILNRSNARKSSAYAECLRPWQFSSMTAKGDPELSLGPNALDTAGWDAWLAAIGIANQAGAGTLDDITHGATSYYALSMTTPPDWAASMTKTATIVGQVFFK